MAAIQLADFIAGPVFVGLVAAWMRRELDDADRHRRAMEAIGEWGGSELSNEWAAFTERLTGPYVFRDIVEFHDQCDDRELEGKAPWIADLVELRILDLSGSKFHDGGLAALRQVPQVTELWLLHAQVDDKELAALQGLANLDKLELGLTDITDDGLLHLRKFPLLARLGLDHARITDAGLVHLRELPSLERLNLDRTRVTDVGMAELARLPRLRWLAIGHNEAITDVGLKHVGQMPALEELRLYGTRVTERGLKHLHGCPQLRVLDLRGLTFPPAAIEALRQALPNCEIVLK